MVETGGDGAGGGCKCGVRPGNHSTSPLSIISLLTGSNSRFNTAWRGGGRRSCAHKLFTASEHDGPDTRITATPHRPWPDDKAKIVLDAGRLFLKNVLALEANPNALCVVSFDTDSSKVLIVNVITVQACSFIILSLVSLNDVRKKLLIKYTVL